MWHWQVRTDPAFILKGAEHDERKSHRGIKGYKERVQQQGVRRVRVIVGMIELDNIRKQDIYQFCKDIITINEKGEDK